uniref:Uncharacterized protein n=1 Tax=Rhizophora mucronata TaxID=61149 RepID=A0A2P2QD76_RHIMU
MKRNSSAIRCQDHEMEQLLDVSSLSVDPSQLRFVLQTGRIFHLVCNGRTFFPIKWELVQFKQGRWWILCFILV